MFTHFSLLDWKKSESICSLEDLMLLVSTLVFVSTINDFGSLTKSKLPANVAASGKETNDDTSANDDDTGDIFNIPLL